MLSPPGLLPLGVGAAPEAVHGPFLPQVPESVREGLAADAPAHARQLADRETRRQVRDSVFDEFSLRPLRRSDRADCGSRTRRSAQWPRAAVSPAPPETAACTCLRARETRPVPAWWRADRARSASRTGNYARTTTQLQFLLRRHAARGDVVADFIEERSLFASLCCKFDQRLK